ncbi:MAG TPA: hypothetical protein PK263_02405 [bacterium]|nr:hypothetical protein [bacterium]
MVIEAERKGEGIWRIEQQYKRKAAEFWQWLGNDPSEQFAERTRIYFSAVFRKGQKSHVEAFGAGLLLALREFFPGKEAVSTECVNTFMRENHLISEGDEDIGLPPITKEGSKESHLPMR